MMAGFALLPQLGDQRFHMLTICLGERAALRSLARIDQK